MYPIEIDLPDNLSFEEFCQLDPYRPETIQDCFYRLTQVYTSLDEDTPKYPEFPVRERKFHFRTFEEAKSYIPGILKDENLSTGTHCLRIEQMPFGGEEVWEEFGGYVWLYDHEGKLMDWTRKEGGQPFFGRPGERIRFMEGDIVEVIDRDCVSLGVVISDGPKAEWFYGMYKRSKEGKWNYFADYSDDQYIILTELGHAGHEHVPSVALLKPRYEIDEDIKAYFKACHESIKEKYFEEVYETVEWFDRISELSRIEGRILYDAESKCHRLKFERIDARDNSQSEIKVIPENTLLVERWLNQNKLGKTRLWYLIRDWNEHWRNPDNDPELSYNTTTKDLI